MFMISHFKIVILQCLFLIGAGVRKKPITDGDRSVPFLFYGQDDPEAFVVNRKVLDKEYDFIVIGAGSAGSVVASRLSEVPSWKVLVLEAGGEETLISENPAMLALLANTRLDWGFRPQPQTTSCLGLNNQQCHWIRGKVVGGSSVLNYMLYYRGNRRDYDNWAKLGNDGWDYKSVVPYFLKSEDNRNPYLSRGPYHATGGLLTVQEAPWRTPLGIAFLEAGIETGYDIVDSNGAYQTGYMIPQCTMRGGFRCSAAKAFLRPAGRRNNLHVAKFARVHRILIDPITMKAHGVIFKRDNMIHTIRAHKEIILSAGAVMSPHILMLSGVGPKDHLESKAIPVLVNSPGVGHNLQDHIGPGGLNFVIDKPFSWQIERFGNLATLLYWITKGRGPYTLPGVLDGNAFVNSRFANASDDYPDIQFHFAAGSIGSDYGYLARHHGISNELYNSVYKDLRGRDSWTILPVLLRQKSRGYLCLNTSNPDDYPLIYTNYLTHPDDIKILLESVRLTFELSKTKAFRRLNSKFWDVPIPQCVIHGRFTEKYWECHIRHYTHTIHHYSCTCKMGPDSDPMAVVDSRLKVKGVNRLRVIDTSIMPELVSGNTNAPTIMIAERGADFIKEEWLTKQNENGICDK